MKALTIISATAVLLASVSCNSGSTGSAAGAANDSTAVEQSVNPETLKPAASLVDSVSYLLGINFGTMVKGYNFGDLNYNQVKKGINDFLNAKGNMRDSSFVEQFKINPQQMGEIINLYIEKRQAYIAAQNKIAEEKFFAANKAKNGVEVTESGLQYTIVKEGTGDNPGPKDTVFVHYKLSNVKGEVIEEVAESDSPAQLVLTRVIPGWTEGLQLIKEGGKATLYVPSKLGYGERGNQGIEPNSPLVFDITLDSVKHFVEPAPENSK